MRIALIGYGKMGHEIEAAAREQGETIACTFDIGNPVDAASLSDVDVCIEFSTPQTVLQNIRVAVQAKKDIVVGTTGWYDKLAGDPPAGKGFGAVVFAELFHRREHRVPAGLRRRGDDEQRSGLRSLYS